MLVVCFHWQTHSYEGGGRLRGVRLPLPFKNQNNCPNFGDCVHLWVKFSIQNAVLRLSRREKSKILPCGAYFSCVFDKMFIEMP